jgi:hypothetical protein
VGVALRLIVRATGFPAPALAHSGPLPGGLSFSDNGDGTAIVAPILVAVGGYYPMTITVANNLGASQSGASLSTSRNPAGDDSRADARRGKTQDRRPPGRGALPGRGELDLPRRQARVCREGSTIGVLCNSPRR